MHCFLHVKILGTMFFFLFILLLKVILLTRLMLLFCIVAPKISSYSTCYMCPLQLPLLQFSICEHWLLDHVLINISGHSHLKTFSDHLSKTTFIEYFVSLNFHRLHKIWYIHIIALQSHDCSRLTCLCFCYR